MLGSGEQLRQGRTCVEQRAFVEDVALRIQDADAMFTITQIETEDEAAGPSRSRRGENDGGLVCQRQRKLTHRSATSLCLLI
jgi:hypothetical protein